MELQRLSAVTCPCQGEPAQVRAAQTWLLQVQLTGGLPRPCASCLSRACALAACTPNGRPDRCEIPYLQLVRGGERGLRVGQRLDRLRHARRQLRRDARAPLRGRRGAGAERVQLRLQRLRCARARVIST
jgi:hypothetical protein